MLISILSRCKKTTKSPKIMHTSFTNILVFLFLQVSIVSSFLTSKSISKNHYRKSVHLKTFFAAKPIVESISSTIINITTTTTPTAEQNKHICRYCQSKFDSRNALFRHIQSPTEECMVLQLQADLHSNGTTSTTIQHRNLHSTLLYQNMQTDKQIVIPIVEEILHLLVSYDLSSLNESESEIITNILPQAFESYLDTQEQNYQDLSKTTPTEKTDKETKSRITSMTQVTAAKMRHVALSQESNCASIGDVIVLSYQKYIFPNQNNNEALSHIASTEYMMQTLNQALQTKWNFYHSDTNDASKSYLPPKVIAIQSLSKSSISSDTSKSNRLHAERACTQRVYHYLFPLSWLPNGITAEEWCRAIVPTDKISPFSKSHRKRHKTPSPSNLKQLKKILKLAESPSYSNSALNPNKKLGSGRFGTLAHRERICWHNFADPALMGKASPSNEPVWRCLDRAKSGQFVIYETDALAMLEFCGDGFVQQQIRRIIGSIVAIVHGYLPESFLEIATRPDVVIETPLAPPNRLYFAEARFHFDELRLKGRLMEQGGILFRDAVFLEEDWAEKIQCGIMNRCASEEIQKEEEDWLIELRDIIAPRIQAQLEQIEKNDIRNSLSENDSNSSSVEMFDRIHSNTLEPTPHDYQPVLNLLRDIVYSKRWPETSVARSKVIRSNDIIPPQKNVLEEEGIHSGSFTVVNPKSLEQSDFFFPKANGLFPELVEAVFELEATLSSTKNRSPSSHCAINCNAQFTPHVDSGRGKGQSLSMIVGLGDYTGGELRVEESKNEIRYNPLEFDGWNQRHWTLPFEGDRFSLVWFSPEL